MDDTRLAGACPRCGRPLELDAPEGLCPACVLAAAAAPADTHTALAEDETALSPAAAPAGSDADGPRLADGQPFGPYRIVRPLGRGGMGEVYEAEHVESGRRLALKVLRGRLGDAADRARFLREGQLAASVSHPHTVYIFGSEEIAGMPVITMELLPGGTLKDRVAAEGPLPYPRAVSAVLDLVGGLDAAQAAGILHRDIKPSNCFTDADGAVKVGDFGLSISTLARDVQATAGPTGFQGTPQFAPPEQLRGEPLDVRADIYAVGATLYYLLTGAPPFQAPDLRELVRRVFEDPAPSPRRRRPDLPKGLAAVVLQCLEKDPRARPATYAALAEALRPYSFTDRRPAPLGLRTIAGVVDAVLVGLPANLMQAWTTTAVAGGLQTSARIDATTSLVSIAYFLALEGATGASLGKRLFGLRVAGARGAASFGQIAVRTAVFSTSQLVILLLVGTVGREPLAAWLASRPAMGAGASLLVLAITAALFATARRANGYAAVHDLVSGTRVIARASRAARRSVTDAPEAPLGWPTPGGAPLRCGPFEVIGELGGDATGRLLLGFDAVLRRRVWIRAVPAGTPPVRDARRDVGRVGRLHWLAGRRAPGDNWDAYEAPDGRLIVDGAARSTDWSIVKNWLVDLARELAASEREGITPRLGLDRLFVRTDGHIVLLDFPGPAVARGRDADGEALTPVGLLGALARTALGPPDQPPAAGPALLAGGPGPLSMPLSASRLLARWSRTGPSSGVPIEQALEELSVIVEAPDRVQRWRRAIPIAAAALPTAVLLAGALAVIPMFRSATTPEMFEVYGLLASLGAADGSAAGPADAADRQAIEVYLAGAYGGVLTDADFWSSAVAQSDLSRLRATAERVAARHPAVPAGELERAAAVVAPRVADLRRDYDATIAPQLARATAFIAVALVGIGLGVSLVASVVSALIVPGGVMTRLLGFAVVTRDGVEIGRARSLARAVAAWAPVVALLAWLGPSPVERAMAMSISPASLAGVVIIVMAAGAAWAIARPERGPVGVVTGTFVAVR